MRFVSIHLASALGKVSFNRVLHKVVGAQSNAQELEQNLGFLDRFLPIIDSQLGRSAHLANDTLTLADSDAAGLAGSG